MRRILFVPSELFCIQDIPALFPAELDRGLSALWLARCSYLLEGRQEDLLRLLITSVDMQQETASCSIARSTGTSFLMPLGSSQCKEDRASGSNGLPAALTACIGRAV